MKGFASRASHQMGIIWFYFFILTSDFCLAGCPRFTPVLWALTWDHSLPLHNLLKFSQTA